MNADFYEIATSESGNRFVLLVNDKPFDSISISDVQTDRDSAICEAPVETGIKSQDHIVTNPTFVTVIGEIACGTVSNFVGNLNYYREIGVLFSVLTPDDYYTRLVVKKIQTKNNAEKYDLTNVIITFQEILFVDGEGGGKTSNSEDSPSVDAGISNVS